MSMLFLQSQAQELPQLTGFAETHNLVSSDPEFERALLLIGGTAKVPTEVPSASSGELMNDTGPAKEPYGAIMLVAFNIPEAKQSEVDDWYDIEHIPMLMKADGWLRVRRFKVITHRGQRWTSLAFHELRSPDVMNAPERHAARSTPWRAIFERETWFQAAGRWVFLPA